MNPLSNKIKTTVLLLSCTVSLISLSGIYKKLKEIKLLKENIENRFVTKKVSGLNLEKTQLYLGNFPASCFEDYEILTLQNDNLDIICTKYDTFISSRNSDILNIYSLSRSHPVSYTHLTLPTILLV